MSGKAGLTSCQKIVAAPAHLWKLNTHLATRPRRSFGVLFLRPRHDPFTHSHSVAPLSGSARLPQRQSAKAYVKAAPSVGALCSTREQDDHITTYYAACVEKAEIDTAGLAAWKKDTANVIAGSILFNDLLPDKLSNLDGASLNE
ncbi:hypothetical protein C8F04DRAFT_1199160 [Mycena alexandri]|uniref:Uncharacterized protein n=1 Tax=Mycena alexandri TaxID=1745969 RepID=A0AAD6S0X8_9AGAR|nr:hypothetical protein C8F04DRAFT_1199160 [Mycena alexandri]